MVFSVIPKWRFHVSIDLNVWLHLHAATKGRASVLQPLSASQLKLLHLVVGDHLVPGRQVRLKRRFRVEFVGW